MVCIYNTCAFYYIHRLMDGSKGVLLQDCDDDGESAAGGRLLHLLQVC